MDTPVRERACPTTTYGSLVSAFLFLLAITASAALLPAPAHAAAQGAGHAPAITAQLAWDDDARVAPFCRPDSVLVTFTSNKGDSEVRAIALDPETASIPDGVKAAKATSRAGDPSSRDEAAWLDTWEWTVDDLPAANDDGGEGLTWTFSYKAILDGMYAVEPAEAGPTAGQGPMRSVATWNYCEFGRNLLLTVVWCPSVDPSIDPNTAPGSDFSAEPGSDPSSLAAPVTCGKSAEEHTRQPDTFTVELVPTYGDGVSATAPNPTLDVRCARPGEQTHPIQTVNDIIVPTLDKDGNTVESWTPRLSIEGYAVTGIKPYKGAPGYDPDHITFSAVCQSGEPGPGAEAPGADNPAADNNTDPGNTATLTVTKVWEDNSNRDGARPESVTVRLTANGKPTGDFAQLTHKAGWKHTFEGLAKGVSYSVTEDPVPGYTATVTRESVTVPAEAAPQSDTFNNAQSVTLTNTRASQDDQGVCRCEDVAACTCKDVASCACKPQDKCTCKQEDKCACRQDGSSNREADGDGKDRNSSGDKNSNNPDAPATSTVAGGGANPVKTATATTRKLPQTGDSAHVVAPVLAIAGAALVAAAAIIRVRAGRKAE